MAPEPAGPLAPARAARIFVIRLRTFAEPIAQARKIALAGTFAKAAHAFPVSVPAMLVPAMQSVEPTDVLETCAAVR